jgi:P-type conjugative transfer protein TrbJ
MNPFRAVVAISLITLAVVAGPKPSAAQLVVFDPNNYAQNVLTAARALQQINNQIVSLQNQAQMLINQAKNLATLPFSSLLQLEQSILRTQQLLAQAQRIAYDIQQIDRAFSTTYASASSGVSNQTLIANAQTRWQNAMAGLQDAMRTQATVVGNLNTNRTQMSALVTSSQGATGALQASQAGNQLLALQAQQLADLTAVVAAHGRAELGICPARRRSRPGQGANAPFPGAGPGLPNHSRADVSLMVAKCSTDY